MRPTLAALRPPSPPPAGHFALVLTAAWVASIKQLLLILDRVPAAQQVGGLGVWALGGACTFSIACAALPLWSALTRRWPSLVAPKLASWLGMLAWFASLGALGGLVRSALVAAWAPQLIQGPAFWGFVLNAALAVGLITLVLACLRIFSDRLVESTQAKAALALQLAQSQAALVAEDERVRAELAHLMHGQVQSQLLAVWAQAKRASAPDALPQEAAAHWREAASVLAEVQAAAVGRVQALMHPNEGQVLTLLAQLVARFERFTALRLEVAPHWAAEAPQLPQRVALLIARMVDEALMKAAGGAEAAPLWLRVGGDATSGLLVELRDPQGDRLGPGALPQGLGLSTLGAELVAQGGEWGVGASSQAGSALTLKVPPALLKAGP